MAFLSNFSWSNLRGRGGSPDYIMAICLAFIILFGLMMLSSASSDLGQVEYGDTYYFFKSQIVKGILLGGLAFLFFYLIDYRVTKKMSLVFLIISLILLLLIFTPLGQEKKGAARWVDLGFLELQPSELVKFAFIIYLASWLSGREGVGRRGKFLEGFLPFLVISGIISGLLILQPATSVVVIVMIPALTIYFVGGGRISYMVGAGVAGLLILTMLVMATPYRRERVAGFYDFLKGEGDTRGAAFHLNQALITIGSGGLWGVGYGNSINKTKHLPEPIGDSIFAVIAEEFGFVGGVILIGVFYLFILRGLINAYKAENDFVKFTLIGFSTLIGIQVFIHIGANSALVPLTGVPLPFVSYGSTAMVVFLSMAGLMLNMSRGVK